MDISPDILGLQVWARSAGEGGAQQAASASVGQETAVWTCPQDGPQKLVWGDFLVLCASLTSLKCCGPVSRVLAFTGQRTGSWGSWSTCKPKPVQEVGFIREKGKATDRTVQWSPETGTLCSGEGWGFYGCLTLGLGKG
jgi:hypothetical protein